MPVEIREILIKTDISSKPATGGELTPQQLEQLRQELLQDIRRERDKSHRSGFNR